MAQHRSQGDDARGGERRLVEGALERVRHDTGLSLMFWGAARPSDGHLRIDTFSGDVEGPLRGLSVKFGNGIGGRAASSRRPVAVDDYFRAEWISHHYDEVIRAEHIQGMLAIPIVVGRRVRAVLYGATRGSLAIGERALRHAAEGARELEQQLAVHDALHASVSEGQRTAQQDDDPERASVDWENVRETFTRLRILASGCVDEQMRGELNALAESLAEPTARDPEVRLTARELDVLACIAQGMSNAEAGQALALSPETVKSYLRSSMRRLRATSRWAAVVAARRAGLLP